MACRPRFTPERLPPDVARVTTMTTMPTKNSTTAPMSTPEDIRLAISDLHLDHPEHPQDATNHQDPTDKQHHDAEGLGVERAQVVAPRQEHERAEDHRQCDQDVARQPSLGREAAHVPPQPTALAHGLHCGLQHLGEVATHL